MSFLPIFLISFIPALSVSIPSHLFLASFPISSSTLSPPPSAEFNAFSLPEWKNTLKILKEAYRMEAAGNEGAETKRKLLLMKWCGTVGKRGGKKKW